MTAKWRTNRRSSLKLGTRKDCLKRKSASRKEKSAENGNEN